MTEKESSRLSAEWENLKDRAEGFVQRIKEGFSGKLKVPELKKKKKKNEDGGFLKEMGRKGAKRIAEATPLILNALKTGQVYSPTLRFTMFFSELCKEPDGTSLALKVSPRTDRYMQNYPRHIFVKYNHDEQTISITNLIHQSDENNRSIEIQIAVFNEVLFEYDDETLADLENIGKFLQVVATQLKK